MTWNRKGGQKDTSYSRDFCPFFLLLFLPFFSFKYQLLSETGFLYGWISDLNQHDSSRPVKPETYSNGDRTWHFGFQKPPFLYEHRQKKGTEKCKKCREEIQGGVGFFKNLKKKRCKKSFALKPEPFHKMRKLWGTFLMVLPRSWNSCGEVWENSLWV